MNALTKEAKERVEKYLKENESANSRCLLFDEDGYYIGPPSEYNDNGVDARTGEPFYGVRFEKTYQTKGVIEKENSFKR